MATRTLSVVFLLISVGAAYGNECSFPASWQDSSWMTEVIGMSKNVKLINYSFDKSCYTATSAEPKLKIHQYNCPAYSKLDDGTQIYLRAEIGKQYTSNGLCIAQKRLKNALLRREAGVQSDLDSCTAALVDVTVYRVLLPIDPYQPDGSAFAYGTTWSVSTAVSCPMSGVFTVKCQPTGSEVCPVDSGVVVQGSTMAILVPTMSTKYKNLPLTGSIMCLADIESSALSEPNNNDKILVLKWSTNSQPNRVRFYCARYRRLSNGTWSLSLDVQDTSRVQCQRYAKHDWQGEHGTPSRQYFRLLFIPQDTASTSGATKVITTTTTTTTTSKLNPSTVTRTTTKEPDTPALHHLQFMLGASYDVYAADEGKAELLKADVKTSLVQICGISRENIKRVQVEVGKAGQIMATFDVKDKETSMESCKEKVNDFIKRGGTITHGRVLMPVRETVYLWKDDSKCPDIFCKTGSYCWIRQGEYTCECSKSSQDSAASPCLARNVVEQSTDNDKRLVTFVVIGVAAFLVLIAVIVIVIVVIRRRQDDKDLASDKDSIGTLEQQDRDMYSSIGKKPTAYHDKQFIVTDESEYTGEKTGIQNSGYK